MGWLVKWNLSQTEPKYNVILSLKEKLDRVEEHNFRYLYEKEPVCSGKIVGPCSAVKGSIHNVKESGYSCGWCTKKNTRKENIRTVAVLKDIPASHLPNKSQNCHLFGGVSGDCIVGRLLPNRMRRPACEGDDGMPRKYSSQVNIVFTCQKCWGYGNIRNWISLYECNLYFILQTSHKYYIPGSEFQIWWLTIRPSGGLLWPRGITLRIPCSNCHLISE